MKIIKVDELKQGDELLITVFSNFRRVIVKGVPKKTTKISWGTHSAIKCDFLSNDLEDYTICGKSKYIDFNYRDILVIKSKNEEI